jgi:hypothetical protein
MLPLHRPQTVPAAHALPISEMLVAPSAIACRMVPLDTASQRQIHIEPSGHVPDPLPNLPCPAHERD